MKNTPSLTSPVSAVLFPLGQVVATPGVMRWLEQFEVSPSSLISRHVRGDWGSGPAEDALANAEALLHGNRILSSYPLGADRVWIITEADRSSTCLLLPDEY